MTFAKRNPFLPLSLIIATLLFLAFGILYGCAKLTTPKKYQIVFHESSIFDFNFLKKRVIKKHIDETVEDVSRYFGIEFRDTLQVYLSGYGYSWSPKSVTMGRNIRSNRYDIVYCIAHAVLKVKPSTFEIEGPAFFIAYKSAPDGGEFFRSKIRYCSFLSDHIRSHDILIDGGDDVYYYRDNWETGYQAGLFYYFLNEKYGTPKLREFYAKGVRGFPSVYGINTETAYAQWRQWLYDEAQKTSR